MNRRKIHIVSLGGLILLLLLTLCSYLLNDLFLSYVLEPLFFFSLLVFYWVNTVNVDWRKILYFIFFGIGMLNFTGKIGSDKNDHILYGSLFMTMSVLVLIKLVLGDIKNKREFIMSLTVFFICFLILYCAIVNSYDLKTAPVFFYGVTFAISGGTCFYNFLIKKDITSKYFFIGMVFKVFGEILFITKMERFSSTIIDSILLIFIFISNYSFTKGFIYSDNVKKDKTSI